MSNLVTVHVLRSLPMHNLNRGPDGLPKSQMDGGIQRGRLSAQSIKRPARIAFRDALLARGEQQPSMRTREAVTVVDAMAAEHATRSGSAYDSVEGKKAAKKVIDALAKAEKDKDAQGSKDADSDAAKSKDNVLLFATAELQTLAAAIVAHQNGGPIPGGDFIQDFVSPALDVAAFGRMFAQMTDKSTQAAVAVSHAITTHPMELTIDYFTAVDDVEKRDENGERVGGSGAAHLGLTYYTSGVYYSTFTIDVDQLKRSWLGFDAPGAREQVALLTDSLVKALPSGRATNTGPYTVPFVVVVEQQRSRISYEFETPVDAARDGGYKTPSVHALADQIALAAQFEPGNVGDRGVFAPEHAGAFSSLDARSLGSVDEIAAFVADCVYA